MCIFAANHRALKDALFMIFFCLLQDKRRCVVPMHRLLYKFSKSK